MPAAIHIEPGMRYARLTYVGPAPARRVSVRTSRRRGLFDCDCGRRGVSLDLRSVRSAHTRSCGCLLDEFRVGPRSHGHTTGRRTSPEYRSWKAMKGRCEQPRVSGYRNYGGRGIMICARWQRFENFLADMGPKPMPASAYTLERLDPDRNYEPGNCRWASHREQTRNQRRALERRLEGCLRILTLIAGRPDVPSDLAIEAKDAVTRFRVVS